MYSGKPEDIGNNQDGVLLHAGQFGLHMRFFFEQLFRVMKPGSLFCCHIQQLDTTKVQHGYMGIRDFRGSIITLAQNHGFIAHGEVAIVKNPQAVAQRRKKHSLMFVTGKRDSRMLAPTANDYVMFFRMPGDGEPIRGLYDRDDNPDGWFSQEDWIKWARGCWDDILEIDILEGSKGVRDNSNEKHVCLARGSLVLTRNGHIPIEQIEIGDMVLTHRGRWRPVIAKQCNGVKPTIQISAQGVPGLRSTRDHLFWTRIGVGQGRWRGMKCGVKRPRYTAMRADPIWLQGDGLKGSYVNLKLPPVEESPYSAKEWWIAGRWLGGGHYARGNALYTSCAHDETTGLAISLGDRSGSTTARRTSTQIRVKDRDRRLRTLLAKCGRGAAGKRLPAEALALDPEKAEALLSGYLSADGHYTARHDRWSATSVSRPLLLGMAMVAQRSRGVACSVYKGRPGGTYEIEGRTVNTLDEWVLSIPPQNLSGFILEDGAWKKVRQVKETGETEVWDIQVAEDESFTAEGCLVHNCPLQLSVIRRCLYLYSAPGQTVLDPFMGIGSTAVIAVEEGRNAIGFELKESYHKAALKNVAQAQRRLQTDKAPLFAHTEKASAPRLELFQSGSNPLVAEVEEVEL